MFWVMVPFLVMWVFVYQPQGIGTGHGLMMRGWGMLGAHYVPAILPGGFTSVDSGSSCAWTLEFFWRTKNPVAPPGWWKLWMLLAVNASS